MSSTSTNQQSKPSMRKDRAIMNAIPNSNPIIMRLCDMKEACEEVLESYEDPLRSYHPQAKALETVRRKHRGWESQLSQAITEMDRFIKEPDQEVRDSPGQGNINNWKQRFTTAEEKFNRNMDITTTEVLESIPSGTQAASA